MAFTYFCYLQITGLTPTRPAHSHCSILVHSQAQKIYRKYKEKKKNRPLILRVSVYLHFYKNHVMAVWYVCSPTLPKDLIKTLKTIQKPVDISSGRSMGTFIGHRLKTILEMTRSWDCCLILLEPKTKFFPQWMETSAGKGHMQIRYFP